MPRLTQIKETKKGRLALFLDGEFAFSLDEDTFAAAALHQDDELEDWQIEELKNMKQTPGSPTDRLWLALPCSFPGRFMAPRGNSYFFLGTHACPASLVPLREFRFSSAGWCGSGVRIAPLRGCYPVTTIKTCIWLLLCALYVYCVYLQI